MRKGPGRHLDCFARNDQIIAVARPFGINRYEQCGNKNVLQTIPNRDPLVCYVSYAFGVRAVAMRDKSILLKINTAAEPSVADQITGFDWLRSRRLDAISIRLRAVEIERDRDVDLVVDIDLVTNAVDLDSGGHWYTTHKAKDAFGRGWRF